MDMRTLVKPHKETTRSLSHRPDEVLLLWYADLGLKVDDAGQVDYHCPQCGKLQRAPLEAFLSVGDRRDPRCNECWGSAEEHGGE
ncbi:MAG: hypothetical protein EXR48_01715 [Dehalococcoidia bacterium]|nr:hypothetical protein [Dehalococcoidia bacterium]